jgi:hypothetical protein
MLKSPSCVSLFFRDPQRTPEGMSPFTPVALLDTFASCGIGLRILLGVGAPELLVRWNTSHRIDRVAQSATHVRIVEGFAR